MNGWHAGGVVRRRSRRAQESPMVKRNVRGSVCIVSSAPKRASSFGLSSRFMNVPIQGLVPQNKIEKCFLTGLPVLSIGSSH